MEVRNRFPFGDSNPRNPKPARHYEIHHRQNHALHDHFNPRLQCAVLLFLRIIIGYRFFLSGKGKLANFDRTTGFFESLHIPAPAFHAGLVGCTEIIAG